MTRLPAWRPVEPGWNWRNFRFAAGSLGAVALCIWMDWLFIDAIREFFVSLEKTTKLTVFKYHLTYIIPWGFWMACMFAMFTVQFLSRWSPSWKGRRWTVIMTVVGITSLVVPFLVNVQIEKRIEAAGFQYCSSLYSQGRFTNVILYSRTEADCEKYRAKYCSHIGSVEFICTFEETLIKNS